MSDIPTLERIFWFHDRVLKGEFPNATNLASQFEICTKTAQRVVTFMRDRMDAPLQYDFSKNGYAYSDNSYELPSRMVSEDEILALLMAKKLLSSSAGGFIGDAIEKFGQKLFCDVGKYGLTESIIEEGFSASWHGYTPSQLRTFRHIASALLGRRPVRIHYRSPLSDTTTVRVVEPHHLQYYMANWMLLAWCRKREDWRTFHLARVFKHKTMTETFEPRPKKEWEHLLHKSFGIFQGKERAWVKLRFVPFRARYIRDQIWHPDQKIEEQPDGGLVLAFPVADFREVSMEILRYGPDVKVLEPDELRKNISEEIRKMTRIYENPIDIKDLRDRKKIST